MSSPAKKQANTDLEGHPHALLSENSTARPGSGAGKGEEQRRVRQAFIEILEPGEDLLAFTLGLYAGLTPRPFHIGLTQERLLLLPRQGSAMDGQAATIWRDHIKDAIWRGGPIPQLRFQLDVGSLRFFIPQRLWRQHARALCEQARHLQGPPNLETSDRAQRDIQEAASLQRLGMQVSAQDRIARWRRKDPALDQDPRVRELRAQWAQTHRALRVAAGLLLANAGIALLIVAALMASGIMPDATTCPGLLLPLVLDSVIGYNLWKGRESWRMVAMFRVAVGLVYYATNALMSGGYLNLLAYSMIGGALLFLLTGDSTRRRRSMAIAAYSLGLVVLAFAPVPDLRHLQAYTHYKKGQDLLESGSYNQAMVEFQEAANIDPAFADSQAGLGWAFFYLEDWEEAIDAFQRTIHMDAKHADAYAGLGWTYYHLEELGRAADAFEQALSIDSRNTDAHAGRGWIHYDQGDIESARDAFGEAIDIQPGNIDALLGQGWAYYAENRPDEAVNAFLDVVSLYPESVDAHASLGTVYYELGQLGKAIPALKQAIQLDPQNAGAHNQLGWIYFLQSRPDEAIVAFETAIDLDPQSPSTYAGLGWAYRDMNRLEEANEALHEAIRLGPDNADAYLGIGWVFLDQDRLDEALDAFGKTATLDPQHSYAYSGLGWVYCFQYELDSAKEAFQKAIDLDPTNAEAYNGLGWIHSELGRSSKAIEAFEQAVLLDPEYAGAYTGLGWANLDLLRLDQALEAFLSATRLEPRDAGAHNGLGWTYYYQRDFARAAGAFQEALRQDPTLANAQEGLDRIDLRLPPEP